MPIYDYDGTTYHEISKLYDFNGTTSTQIGKVYDCVAGGASTLIYNADQTLFPNGVSFVGKGVNTGTVTSTYIKAECNGSSKTNSSVRTSNKVDLTAWSKITFVITSRYANGNAQVNVGATDRDAPNTTSSYTVGLKITATGTFAVDVSSLSGEYYVAISSWGSTGSSGITCTSIVLE